MSAVIAALLHHAIDDPRKTALQDAHGTLSYGDLMSKVESLARRLRALSPRAIAILADNGRDWAVVDLAALMADIPAIPIPPFFSSTQIAHTLRTAGVDHVCTDQPARIRSALQRDDLPAAPFCGVLQHVPLHDAGARAVLPEGTGKVTFTSGTTGEPRGCAWAEIRWRPWRNRWPMRARRTAMIAICVCCRWRRCSKISAGSTRR